MKRVKQSGTNVFFPLIILTFLASCATVKPNEKAYLNDGEMVLALRKLEKLEINFQLYREGSSGATGGKSSGGCGCN
ncbi:MAG: DUF4266 domain-containing protein [Saprospiraceae bacterium]|jgi:hypothetical protein|nr:DUF4266 domain-containing protein [Saprospiraceae bacterium]